MTDFSPGDIVDVTITGVRVIDTWTGHIAIDVGTEIDIDITNPAVTITRRAPQPQADLLAAVSELHNAIRESKNAEAVKTCQAFSAVAAAIRASTVTRHTPQPQSGDVWEHPTHGRMLFTDHSGDLWAWDMQGSGCALTGLNMTGAVRLYPSTPEESA